MKHTRKCLFVEARWQIKVHPGKLSSCLIEKAMFSLEVLSGHLHNNKFLFFFLVPLRTSFPLHYFHSCMYFIPTDATGTSKFATITASVNGERGWQLTKASSNSADLGSTKPILFQDLTHGCNHRLPPHT